MHENQYRATLDSMRDAIHVVDSDLIILVMNARFKQWCAELGLEIGDPIGRSVFEVFPHLPDRVKEEYHQVFASGQVLTTVEVTEAQGREVATEARKIPVHENDQVVRVVTVVRDITEQERIKKESKAAEERIRVLFETIPHALYECDKNGIITLTNSAYSRITGYSKGELLGMHIQELMLPGPQRDELPCYLEYLVKEKPVPTPYMARNLTKDGQSVDVEINWDYRCNEQDQVVGFVCILSDVTERKKAEEALHQSEDQYRSLVVNMPGVVWRTDQTGKTSFIGPNVKEIYGYSQAEIYEQGSQLWFDRIHPEDVNKVKKSFKSLFKEGMRLDVEYRIQRKDGEWIWLQDRSIGTYEKENMKYADGVFVDITTRKQAETKLLDYQRQLKSLATQLTLTEEQEKRRIAEQLHDDVGQCLAFCKMNLQLVIASISEQSRVDELETVCEMLTQSMDHINDLTYDLSSPILKELGFEKAIGAWLKDDIESKHGVKTQLIADYQTEPINDEIKAILFRSIRELVTNSVKHANPGQIHVCISREKEDIVVCVEDDGDGFDPRTIESASKKRYGLFSIRERLDYLGGCLELISSPGHGCKAVLKVPLS